MTELDSASFEGWTPPILASLTPPRQSGIGNLEVFLVENRKSGEFSWKLEIWRFQLEIGMLNLPSSLPTCTFHQRAGQAPTKGKSRRSNLATSVRQGLDQERAVYTVLSQLSDL